MQERSQTCLYSYFPEKNLIRGAKSHPESATACRTENQQAVKTTAGSKIPEL